MSTLPVPTVRLHPDFSVAQAAVDRRTVVMLYHQTPAEPLEMAFDGPLPWVVEKESSEL